MNDEHAAETSKRVYRVDKFVIPFEAREEFLTNVQKTHDLLKTLPGFMQDFVLEQISGPGEFNFVTLVEWESLDAIANAKIAVAEMHERTNFHPQEMFSRLGIKADLANYRQTDAQQSVPPDDLTPGLPI